MARPLSRREAVAGVACLVSGCAHAEPPTKIRREDRISVDGALLYLLVRGDDPAAPVLLWLHGGPGGAERPLFRLFNGDLERRFVVAYLDQRGTGRSYDPEADPKVLTIARHLTDLARVVDHLNATLGRDKVILVGHSWGSALGMLYAKAHPEKVAAVVGVAQVVTPLAADQAQRSFVETEARRRGDADALNALAVLKGPPFATADELKLERLVDRFGGLYHRRPNFALSVVRGVAAGYVGPSEIPRMIHANNVSLEAMADEIYGLDLRRDAPGVKVPVVFMLGRHDRHVDSGQAAAYFADLDAPAKRLMWFENSAHNVPFEEPDLFNAALPRLLAEVKAIR
jgi:pimeloyl-ACP methyl ester carboxylesterase